MKTYNCKYINQGKEFKCQLFADSLDDAKNQFKRFSYLKGSILTFIGCEHDEARESMLKAINGVMRRNQFCLN
jgi:hypothetical protein